MSSPEIVHPVPVEDAPAWVAQLATSLLNDPYDPSFGRRVERWTDDWRPDRTWAVRDRGRTVGTLATQPRVLTVPGVDGDTRDVVMDALTGVSVAATHRRRGLLTRMIGESLRTARERGEILSGLLAAEWPIYGRYGYAPATRLTSSVYRTRGRGAGVTPDPRGFVRQVEPDELVAHAEPVFDRARRRRAGQVDRPGWWWRRTVGALGAEPTWGQRHHWVLHEGVDGPSGLLGWRPSRDWDTDGTYAAVSVISLVAADDLAYRNLWAYLAGLDVVEEVELDNRPVDEPARWLMADGRALRQTYTGDGLWLRLLDVPAALSARGYATAGRVVLDVVDDAAVPYAAGRVALDASPDGATCSPTTASADLTLPARALASVFLGGHSLRLLAAAGQVDEHTAGALARADAMFATGLAPWNQTGF